MIKAADCSLLFFYIKRSVQRYEFRSFVSVGKKFFVCLVVASVYEVEEKRIRFFYFFPFARYLNGRVA